MKIEATPRSRAGEIALSIYEQALDSVRADRLIKKHVHLEDNCLSIGGVEQDPVRLQLDNYERIIIAGAGKASPRMALGLEQLLGDRIDSGLIITKHGHSEVLSRCEVFEASHPVPDEDSLEAGRRMLDLAKSVTSKDLVLFVLSGGASALMEAPVDSVSLGDLKEANRMLLASGALIMTVNAIRAKLSKIKQGGLSRAFQHSNVVVLVLSDVFDDPLSTVGSGPFLPARPGLNVSKLAQRYDLLDKLPPSISFQLLTQYAGVGDPSPVEHRIIGSCDDLLLNAMRAANEFGFAKIQPMGLHMKAEDYRQMKERYLAMNPSQFESWPGPVGRCGIGVGEMGVEVRGKGLGGRAQDLACLLSHACHGWANAAALVAGTDGTDGPTDAAGALVDGSTVARALEKGFTVRQTLEDNDSYHFHEAAGTLIKTGPTGTNVNDIVIVVRT